MYDLTFIRSRLQDSSLSVVAKKCGINAWTLRRIISGHTDARVSHIEALSRYIDECDKKGAL